ncbi:MAG: flagellar motor protein MotB [Bacillota bacterium]
MAGKKVHQDEHADETWLLPYADLLTLLLALFIVMFAISNVDKEKFEKLSEQFGAIFAGTGGIMEEGGSTIILVPDLGSLIAETEADNSLIEEDNMVAIKETIEGEIEKHAFSDRVKVALDKEGLEIAIQDIVLFNPGEAKILTSVHPLLLQIAKTLNNLDNKIKVVGHTDNIPIRTEKYESNWELSAMRSINVMNFMVEKGGLEPWRFSIEGFGEYSPKYDNSTEGGRAKNRRVEILLIRKYPVNN